jgi:hypothetical protein
VVGLAQPVCLPALGTDWRRYECNMNLQKRKTRGVSFHYKGLDGKHLVFCRRREAFVLTSSFIERAYRQLGIWASHIPINRQHGTWVQLTYGKALNDGCE